MYSVHTSIQVDTTMTSNHTLTTTAPQHNGGYNLQFAETIPSSLICLICSFPACEPHQMKCCQTIYCHSCLDELRKKSNKCPNCHKLAFGSFHLESHNQLMKLSVKCVNSTRGCAWLGTLRNYLEVHTPACPKEIKHCTYYDVGCRAKILREDQAVHNVEKMGYHFACALDTIQKMKKVETELQRSVIDLKSRVQPIQPVAVIRMPHFDEHRTNNRCWYSTPFFSHPKGYKMCLRVDANGIASSHGTHVSLFVCLMQGDYDDELVWPFQGKIPVELLNQIHDSHHHTGIVKFDSPQNDECNSRVTAVVSGTGRGWPQFISHKLLSSGLRSDINCQYLKGDSLYFRIQKIEVHDANKPWLICT